MLTRAPGYTDIAPHYRRRFAAPDVDGARPGTLRRRDENCRAHRLRPRSASRFYGQLASGRVATTWALSRRTRCYRCRSSTAHPLAGYADFHVAAAFALAILGARRVEQRRERYQQC